MALSRRLIFALFCCCAVLLLTSSSHATNGLKLTSYGPRAAGRGGVDYAIADDGTAGATNPAGLAFIWGNRFDNNWAIILPSVTWSNSFGSFDDRDVIFAPVPAFSLGVSLDPSKDWEISPLFDFGNWGLKDEKEAEKKKKAKKKKKKKTGKKKKSKRKNGALKDKGKAKKAKAPAKKKDKKANKGGSKIKGKAKATDEKAKKGKDAGEKGKKGKDAKKGEGPKGSDEDFEPEGDFEEQAAGGSEAELYGSRIRIGIGVFPVTGGKIQIKKMRTSGFPAPKDWESDVLRLALSPSIAYRINKHFSVGVALQIHYTQFELDGGIAQPSAILADNFEFASSILNVNPQTLTFADIDDGKTDFDNNNGQWGISFKVGLMFTSKYFSAGLVYQDRTHSSDILGRATVDATDEVNTLTQGNTSLLQIVDPRINPALGFASVYDIRVQGFEFPRYLGLGVSVRPHERVSFGVDYTFIMWSEVMKTFKSRLSNGNNANLDIMTSSSIHVKVPLDWDDQHVIAVGASFLVLKGDDIVEGVPSFQLVLRAGYNFGANPAPEDTALPQQPVITEHHITSGFTLHLGPLMEINFSMEYALPNEIRTPPLHRGDFTLANSKQEVSILFFQFGIGANF